MPKAHRKVVVAFALVAVGCSIPRDPQGTFERVRSGTLRAGISDNEPWVRSAREQPGGIEVELLEELAGQLGATIEWKASSEGVLFKALEHGEIDVVAAGLEKSTPWKKSAALTQPYVRVSGTPHVLAVQLGENRWLLELERFLQPRSAAILNRHAAEAKR
jgi:membrane-bound lytic murein transglycosylase MltF